MLNKLKPNKILLVIILILLVLAIFFIASDDKINPNLFENECAKDYKVCPDGSYVIRSGFNCEFICSKTK
jgi:hypothetical protein